MNRIILLTLFLLNAFHAFAQPSKGYQFTLDIAGVKNDQVNVEIITPGINSTEAIYYLPKIVPGTYSEDNFGRYVEDFRAFDKNGNELTSSKIEVNGWKIENAKKLYRITYKVNDSFDDTDSTSKRVFEPCGSNIVADTNFVINTHCFLGYIDGYKNVPYKLAIQHQPYLFGVTAMDDLDNSTGKDVYKTDNYNQIVDNPIMYCRPDTTTINLNGTSVLLGVYSPNRKITSTLLADNVYKLLQAQAKYLGGKLPVKKYAFIIYLTDRGTLSGAMGALEHSYSSMYVMPEGEPKDVLQFLMDVAAHEFFHIVTPLSIHSEEIQYFDFNNPKMSKHLWLYEGTTEYHAHLAQAKAGLISGSEFLDVLSKKINFSKSIYIDSLSFTEMSSNVLSKYKNQFGNVYQKGALIAMCLDIKLRQLSNGKKGLIDMINELSKVYGKNRPFKDDEIFDKIGQITYPEIKQFLVDHVEKSAPLPFKEIFHTVGVEYIPEIETKDSVFTLGKAGITQLPSGKFVISNISALNDFGKKMGYQKGDTIISVNGTRVDLSNYNGIVQNIFKNAKTGNILTIVVERPRGEGSTELVTLSAPMMKIAVKKFHVVKFLDNPTPAQLALRKAWLGTK